MLPNGLNFFWLFGGRTSKPILINFVLSRTAGVICKRRKSTYEYCKFSSKKIVHVPKQGLSISEKSYQMKQCSALQIMSAGLKRALHKSATNQNGCGMMGVYEIPPQPRNFESPDISGLTSPEIQSQSSGFHGTKGASSYDGALKFKGKAPTWSHPNHHPPNSILVRFPCHLPGGEQG